MSNEPFRTEAFVVRIWNEALEPQETPQLWRGSVEHVETREIRHFRSFGAMVRFMAGFVAGFPYADP